MAVSSVWTLFAISFVICLHLAHPTVYQIKSSQSSNQVCPKVEQICVTLSEFSTNFTTDTNNENKSVTLVFLPGNHILESQLTFTNLSSVAMVKSNTTMVTQPVIITCNHDTKFEFIELNSLLVVGLTFVGCTGTKVESVHTFTLEDSIFEGQNVGTALKLDRVAASVVGSSFSSFGGESIEYFITCCSHLRFTPYLTRLRVGGTIIANHSRLVIDNSDFQHNTANIGGVIYSAHQSNISITNSNFTNNSANFVDSESDMDWCHCGGGVLQSDNSSSIYISNSQFRGNSAWSSGGVVSVVDSVGVNSDISITITNNSAFTNNSAGQYGGALSVYSRYSSNSTMTLTISNCDNIMNNHADWDGGVVSVHSGGTSDSMILTISDCDIMNNNADRRGGVVSVFSSGSTDEESQIIITVTDSDFTNNTASGGGVFYLFVTSFRVTATPAIAHSKFTHNTANHGGGVIDVNMFSLGPSATVVVNISDHSIFSDNKAIGSNGGVIRALGYGSGSSLAVHIADSDIKHNEAHYGGGVVSVESDSDLFTNSLGFSADIVFTGCQFIGNQANHAW